MRQDLTRRQADPQALEGPDRPTVADNIKGARFVAIFVLLIFVGGFIASFTPILPMVQAALGP